MTSPGQISAAMGTPGTTPRILTAWRVQVCDLLTPTRQRRSACFTASLLTGKTTARLGFEFVTKNEAGFQSIDQATPLRVLLTNSI